MNKFYERIILKTFIQVENSQTLCFIYFQIVFFKRINIHDIHF